MTLSMAEELRWLQDNPHFHQRPASMPEFLGAKYLDVEDPDPDIGVRPAIREMLIDMFGEEANPHKISQYEYAMVTGGIGIGKTTISSFILCYMTHWTLCLRDPQRYFKLLSGSRIAFMQMSTSGQQAKEVVFGDVKGRIEHSPWFQEWFPFDTKFKNQLRFTAMNGDDVWILPGDSGETTFEGYNILGGILDEADSHQITKVKDYAEAGYAAIDSRIKSRFGKRGFFVVIGQMKKTSGFAAKKYKEFQKLPEAYCRKLTIWESYGWESLETKADGSLGYRYCKPDGTRDSFWYDIKRYEETTEEAARLTGNSAYVIEVPEVFRQPFENNPVKALRDLAGIPPAAGSPFIVMVTKLEAARDRWITNNGDQLPVDAQGRIAEWVRATTSMKRCAHIDMAYSGEGDALGFAMGHVKGTVKVDNELKPFISIDLLLRWHAPKGQQIYIADVRQMIYMLKKERKFKLDFVSTDGFESTDTRQQLARNRIDTDKVSVDRDLTPYYDLRDAVYEDRIEFPPYYVRYLPEDTLMTEVLIKELSELSEENNKIDHPPDGSKDVADAVAAVVYHLMGDRTYQRRSYSADVLNPNGSANPGSNSITTPSDATQSPGQGVRIDWRPPARS